MIIVPVGGLLEGVLPTEDDSGGDVSKTMHQKRRQRSHMRTHIHLHIHLVTRSEGSLEVIRNPSITGHSHMAAF